MEFYKPYKKHPIKQKSIIISETDQKYVNIMFDKRQIWEVTLGLSNGQVEGQCYRNGLYVTLPLKELNEVFGEII